MLVQEYGVNEGQVGSQARKAQVTANPPALTCMQFLPSRTGLVAISDCHFNRHSGGVSC
jgi:hypothetical protein